MYTCLKIASVRETAMCRATGGAEPLALRLLSKPYTLEMEPFDPAIRTIAGDHIAIVTTTAYAIYLLGLLLLLMMLLLLFVSGHIGGAVVELKHLFIIRLHPLAFSRRSFLPPARWSTRYPRRGFLLHLFFLCRSYFRFKLAKIPVKPLHEGEHVIVGLVNQLQLVFVQTMNLLLILPKLLKFNGKMVGIFALHTRHLVQLIVEPSN
mmetsp:Transcript_25065/g.39614  ORF Transcript_25065/g.39614 Transcript_25065/m.39614 type:complete len:207 (-) Transcript_25065:172-792(-)